MTSAADIQHLADMIASTIPVERIVLFGSHARGEATPDSDVDLLVILPDGADRIDAAAAVSEQIISRRVMVPAEIVYRTRSEFDAARTRFSHLMWMIDREGRDLHDAA